jgi:hypothetical protein
MQKYSQIWMIGKQMFPEEPCAWEYQRERLCSPRSLAFFCPICGEVWARRIILPENRWFLYTIPCEKHAVEHWTHALVPPGSVIPTWEEELLRTAPLEIMRREAWLCLEHGLKDRL